MLPRLSVALEAVSDLREERVFGKGERLAFSGFRLGVENRLLEHPESAFDHSEYASHVRSTSELGVAFLELPLSPVGVFQHRNDLFSNITDSQGYVALSTMV